MTDAFRETVCQIAVFMICAQAIAHFRPKESYGKYLRMLLSVMILVQIFQPFSSLLFGVSGQELSLGMAAFWEELEESMDRASKQAALTEKRLESMSLEEVQERLAQQEQMAGQEQVTGQEQVMGQEQVTGQGQVMEQQQPEEEVDISAVEPIEIRVEIPEE